MQSSLHWKIYICIIYCSPAPWASINELQLLSSWSDKGVEPHTDPVVNCLPRTDRLHCYFRLTRTAGPSGNEQSTYRRKWRGKWRAPFMSGPTVWIFIFEMSPEAHEDVNWKKCVLWLTIGIWIVSNVEQFKSLKMKREIQFPFLSTNSFNPFQFELTSIMFA